MTFKEYVDKLNTFIKENPDVENLTIIYSSDDEGNSYQEVGDWDGFPIGHHSGEYRGDFISKNNDPEWWEECEYTDEDINAICIN